MKREILFKAKRTDNGEWIEGNLIENNVIAGKIIEFNDEYFNTEYWRKVVPETVCQFTGLTDKNGVKIFEGDKCISGKFKGIVEFSHAGFNVRFDDNVLFNFSIIDLSTFEVIGNIHD